jgi:hypothetical protein
MKAPKPRYDYSLLTILPPAAGQTVGVSTITYLFTRSIPSAKLKLAEKRAEVYRRHVDVSVYLVRELDGVQEYSSTALADSWTTTYPEK